MKGDRFFRGSTVASTGLGTVATTDGIAAVTATEEGNVEAGVGEVIEDGAVKPAPPTLRARIVGQGYKQACHLHPGHVTSGLVTVDQLTEFLVIASRSSLMEGRYISR